MKIEVRVFATLADVIDHATSAVPFELDLAQGATVGALIEQLGLDSAVVHLVVIDGRTIHDRTTRLTEGSRVALFPPVGGG